MKEEKDFMLSTYDNDFNPFTDFVRWWKEDIRLGHDCCGLIDRLSNCSNVFSDKINEQIVSETIDEIVTRWPRIYRKVYKSDFDKPRNPVKG